ncbi:MAG TPA: HAMP domain-containing sensor histidine kinase [Pilimelia sp.]|nr:HAMP domain-containing sensor histidine kinase [Pilimelia sp.]
MRSRLTLLVAATTSLVLVAFLIPLALLMRTVAEDRAVGEATGAAQSLVPLVATGDPETIRLAVEQATAESAYPITVFLPDGTVVGAPARRTAAVQLAATGRSLNATTPTGREVVVAVQGLPGGTAVVRTALPAAALRRGVDRAWLLLGALGLALIAIGLVVADRLARAVVRPIVALSAVSHRLGAGDLSARAEPSGPPEVRDVAAALNQLASRIRDLLQQERETVADLSHRLRTPLTALRLEVEALPDPALTRRVAARVDGVERAVSGLIRHARRRTGPEPARCDAAAVVRDRVDFWSVLAEDTGRAARVEVAAGPLPVAVSADELAAALDAVLGNVFAHTPDGVAFGIRLVPRSGGGAELTVTDEGPGLPTGSVDPARRGVSGGDSTGLGLDSARRAAEASGGALRLGPGPGAAIIMELGGPSS